MRERLVAAFVGLTVLVVALYGIPRAYILADLVRANERDQAERTASLIATAMDMRLDAGGSITPAVLNDLAEDGERIVVETPEADVSSTGGAADASGDIRAEATLARGGTVTVIREAGAVSAAVAQAILPLVLIGLVLVVLAGGLGFLIARRLARPFQELAGVARGLGTGRLDPDLTGYRVPEAQAIADALTVSGRRVDALLQHERELAVHASHELRTPVTALRLELEDISLWPETPASVRDALAGATKELDRLSTAVGDLLAGARERLTDDAMDLDLDALVEDTAQRHRTDTLVVEHPPSDPLPTRLDPRPVVEVIEFLLGAAARGGAAHVVIAATDQRSHHEITVASGAPLRDPADAVGWTHAEELATALGGQLLLRDGTTAVLRLPQRPLTGS